MGLRAGSGKADVKLNNAMHILVTGGAGCIGSELVSTLLTHGHSVCVFDNLSSGKLEHIEPFMGNPAFQFQEGDMLDRDAVGKAVAGVDFVYHLAANPDVKYTPGDATNKDLEQNTLATYYLLEAMRLAGIRKLAFSSTSAVYGISERQPIPEDNPLRPISLYGATKMSCEGLISAFAHLFEMQVWIFRFANVVGSRVRKRGRTVISDFIHKLRQDSSYLEILGNGRQAKSYLVDTDCIDAMLFCVANAGEQYNVYNLGCDDQLDVISIAHMVVEGLGLGQTEFRFTGGEGGWLGDVPRFTLDVSRLNALGWRARYSSREAVAMTIAGLLRQTAG